MAAHRYHSTPVWTQSTPVWTNVGSIPLLLQHAETELLHQHDPTGPGSGRHGLEGAQLDDRPTAALLLAGAEKKSAYESIFRSGSKE